MPHKLTRAEQARINGAKSHGPITPDGKARSSRNSITHGFGASVNTVISIEDKPAWELHLTGFRATFLPQNYVEQTLIDQLAYINWRQSRLAALETSLIDNQIALQAAAISQLHAPDDHDPYFHLALAWQGLARQPQRPAKPIDPDDIESKLPAEGHDISSIELVRRYLVTLDRSYRNVLLNLRQIRKDFAPPATQPPPVLESTQNEPNPLPELVKIPREYKPPTPENRPILVPKPAVRPPATPDGLQTNR